MFNIDQGSHTYHRSRRSLTREPVTSLLPKLKMVGIDRFVDALISPFLDDTYGRAIKLWDSESFESDWLDSTSSF